MNEYILNQDDSRFKETSRSAEILHAAARLFYEHGVNQVGMRLIADEVGVTAPTLYHHFKSKNDIFFQVALGATKAFTDMVLPVLHDESLPPPQRLKAFVREHIAFRWYRRYWVSSALQDLRSLEPAQYAEVMAQLQHYQGAIQDFVERGAAAGIFRVRDPRLAGLMLIGILNGVNDWFRADGRLTITNVADEYADMIVDQLLAAPVEE